MIKDTDLIEVRNRNMGPTGYTIPDQNIHRSWGTGETKKIPFGELRSFSYLPGGIYALKNLFVVENKEALDLLLNEEVEPEYYYTKEDIKKMLLEGSIDQFADFLDFAPDGAIDIAKDIAVREEIPDVRKREMLSKKTGLNINNAIMINKIMDEDSENAEAEAPKQRRVQVEEPKEGPKRKAAAPNYKVISKG